MIILYFLLSGRAPILNKLLDMIAHFYIKMSFHINVKDSTSKYGVIVSFYFFFSHNKFNFEKILKHWNKKLKENVEI